MYLKKQNQIKKENLQKYKKVFGISDNRSSDYAQALMELGALICKPLNPLCKQCPILRKCKSFRNQDFELVKLKKKDKQTFYKLNVYKKNDQYLLIKNDKFNFLKNFDIFPMEELISPKNFNKDLLEKPTYDKKLIVRKNLCSDIAILKLFPGIPMTVVQSILTINNLKGVVMETYGAGNAPNNKEFIDLLSGVISKGLYIVNVTQCVGGSVLPGHYETSSLLKNIGVIDAKDMTTESAIAKLMYLLGVGVEKDKFAHYFEQSLRGEITNK